MTRYQTALTGVSWLIIMMFAPGLKAQSPPTLVFPKNTIVTSTTSIPFEWNAVQSAINYHIQIAEGNSFSTLSYENTNVSGTTFTFNVAGGKKYYWRVRANTPSGYTTWSVVWSLTIFSPSNATSLVTWYKADYGVHVDVNGKVSQWDDASGNGNNGVQTDPNLSPALVNSVCEINNKPLLRFDGVKNYITFTNALTSIETVFWVINESPSATNKYRSLLGDMNREPYFHRGCCDGGFPGPTRYIYDNQYPSDNSCVRDGVTRINGTVVPAISTNVPTSLSIISTRTACNAKAENFSNDRNYDGGQRVWWGDLAELIFYNDPLSDSLINLVNEYLRSKYAPAVNLGANVFLPYNLCGNVTLSVSGCYKSYSWSTGAVTTSIQVSSPGAYILSVTDQFNGVSKDTISVNFVRPQVIQPAQLCFGDSIVWDTGLNNAYTFQWQDGSTGSSYVIYGEGDYWVKVTDSTGCSYQTPPVHIDVDSFAAMADLGTDTSICQGQSIGLVSGANLAVDYLWSTGSNSPTISISDSGTYYLTVTDAFGCQKVDSIFVDVGENAPTTNFTATSVCFGFSNQFTNSSTIDTPNIITQYHWDFGDGQFDTVHNPTHTYAAPGNYQVKLTATADNLCLNSKTNTVRVYNLPEAYFTDSVACAGFFMEFEDASIPASGSSINSWHWDFNDNSISSQQNPTHQFDSVRTYHVKLDITDSRGCQDSYTRDLESVIPVALAAQPGLVSPLDNVTLSDSSILFYWQQSTGALSYTLQISTNPFFSNIIRSVNTGSADSAIISGLTFGSTYYWKVQAFNLCGYPSPSEVYRFNLFQPTAAPGLCLWLTAGHGDSLDLNGTVAKWRDRSPSLNDAEQTNGLRRPLYIPSVPELNGMPADSFDGVDDYVAFDKISSIRTVFWVIKESANATPYYRSLLGNSTTQPDFHRGCCTGGFPGPDKFIYDETFAATPVYLGTTRVNGTTVNPLETNVPTQFAILSTRTTGGTESDCFTCDRPSLITLDPRYWEGQLAELIIYCQPLSDSLINVVENYLHDKYAPPVNLGPDITLSYGVCAPTTLSAGDRFTRYRWSNGDTTSSIQVYGQGTYSVIVTDIFGRTSYDAVTITGGLNTVTFADTLFLCMDDSLVWNTGLTHDYDFLWQDGSTDSFFVIKDPGYYWVKVTDTTALHCSITSDTVFVQIDSFSVQATLGPDTNLCSGNRISLTVGGEKAVSYSWSDGSTQPEFTVHTTRDYSVTVENINQCFASDTIHVNIIGVAPNADFSFNTPCLNDTVHLSDLTTPPAISSWHWNFGDNTTSSVQHPAHFYTASGIYPVTLTVADTIGCSQNITKPVTVYPLPVAAFTHDLVNCANDLVHFHNASTIAAGQTITVWKWSFGDGTSISEINPIHTYQTRGVYPVSLEVMTDRGCTSIAYDTIEIFPELKAEIGVGNLCFDYPVDFHDNSPNFSTISWNWDFGDRSFSTQENPVHIYDFPSTFVVTLKVKNAIGCQRTTYDTITVTSHPTVDFNNPSICENISHQFFDNTTTNGGDNVVAWQWTFGDNSNVSHVQNPMHAYDSSANYNVTLKVRTKNGCENFVTKPVTVIQPPVANFTFTPSYGAAPLTVNFTNHSQGGTDYLWNFGDNSATSTEIHPSHTYQQNDTVSIQLVAANQAGCSDTAISSFNISKATIDIALNNIILEKAFNTDCSYFLKMGAYVMNIGTRDVTSFDILASNSNGGTIMEHWEGDFTNRQTTYPFNADFLINDCAEDVVICMEVMNPNGDLDENPLNNRKCITLSSDLVVIGPSPNPTGDFVNLDILTPSKGDLRINNYNVIGQHLGEMKKGQVDKGYHQYNFDVSHLPPGVYLLKIEFNEESRVIKYTVK